MAILASCKDIALELSESLDRKMSLKHRLRVGLHVAICKECRNLKRQLLLLRVAIRKMNLHPLNEVSVSDSFRMPTNFRARLKETMIHYEANQKNSDP